MRLSLDLVKANPEILLSGLLIMGFGITNQQVLLLGVVLIGVIVAAIFPFGRNIQFLIFLLPCSAVFMKATYLPVSLATLVFLAVFGRYMMTQMASAQYHKAGLAFTLILIIFELMHIIYNPVMVSTQTIRWLILFVFVALLLFDRNKYASFSQVRYALLVGLFISTFYGLLSKYFHPEVIVNGKIIARFAGGAGDPNNYGLFCLLLIFFYLPAAPKIRINKVGYFVILAMLFCGSLTVSRSFFLVTTLSLFMYFVLYFKDAMGSVFFRLLAVTNILFTLIVVFMLWGQSIDLDLDILKRFDSNNLSELTGSRSDILKEYVAMFFRVPFEYLLFGAGINGYLGYYNYYFLQQGLFEEVVGPHNTFLEILISFGIVGSGIIIGFVYSAFKAEQIRLQNYRVYKLAFIPFAVFVLYSFSLQNLGKYSSFFILMMIIYSTYRRDN